MKTFAIIGDGFSETCDHYFDAIDVQVNNGWKGQVFISMALFNIADDLLKQCTEVRTHSKNVRMKEFERMIADINRFRTSLRFYFAEKSEEIKETKNEAPKD